GLTWLFGLLAVNRNTSAFAWIFTLLNTLQGAAIFFFHVVRSDKVWSKLSPRINKVKRGLTSRTRTYNYISTSSTMKTSKDSQSSISMRTIKKSVVENDYSTASSLGFANTSVEDGDDEKIELAKLEEKMPTEEKVEEMSLSERAKEKEKEALGSD
uniref:G-protein coupled receptors family 2 profile 2 domain-containing protein n=1 Tax=Amphimedon queenslandica TaxID=400682 RepID=A0A1X7T8J3_AMPQE